MGKRIAADIGKARHVRAPSHTKRVSPIASLRAAAKRTRPGSLMLQGFVSFSKLSADGGQNILGSRLEDVRSLPEHVGRHTGMTHRHLRSRSTCGMLTDDFPALFGNL